MQRGLQHMQWANKGRQKKPTYTWTGASCVKTTQNRGIEIQREKWSLILAHSTTFFFIWWTSKSPNFLTSSTQNTSALFDYGNRNRLRQGGSWMSMHQIYENKENTRTRKVWRDNTYVNDTRVQHRLILTSFSSLFMESIHKHISLQNSKSDAFLGFLNLFRAFEA